MKILVHDYCGHPFQVQLSRALAMRGHAVTHLYSSSNPTTPKGAVEHRAGDPATLNLQGLALPKHVSKTALLERWRLERLYGRRLAKRIIELVPEVVLLSNTPLDAASAAQRACRRRGIPMVFWLQDLIGEATERILSAKLGRVGRMIGRHYQRAECQLLRSSAHVVGISEDFALEVEKKGVPAARYTTIPNWAPLDEVVPRPKDNPWARQHRLENKFVFLYSGTLGFKHNPGLLLHLAHEFSVEPNVRVVVNSEGEAAEWLRAQGRKASLEQLLVNGYQPYEAMSNVLGAADVLVSILEAGAGLEIDTQGGMAGLFPGCDPSY